MWLWKVEESKALLIAIYSRLSVVIRINNGWLKGIVTPYYIHVNSSENWNLQFCNLPNVSQLASIQLGLDPALLVPEALALSNLPETVLVKKQLVLRWKF